LSRRDHRLYDALLQKVRAEMAAKPKEHKVRDYVLAALGDTHGIKFFTTVCEQNLEGIVGKRKDSLYTASAVRSWVKIRNPNYTQTERRRELFESFRQARQSRFQIR
jgi:ATP-dependent DNA ligase